MFPAAPYLPHLILIAGALAILGMGAFARARRALYPLALLSVVAALAASLTVYPCAPSPDPGLAAFLDSGPLAAFYLPLLCLLGLAALLFFGPYAGGRDMDRDEPYALLLFALCGGLILAGGKSWAAFYIGMELLSQPLYVVIASRRATAGRDGGAEAAVKYFALGAVASATLVFGIALVYAGGGSLEIARSLAAPEGANTALLGLGFILAGLGFKLALVPFHFWAPDVYQGAPAPVAAFLSSVAKAAAIAGLLRVVMAMGQPLWPAFTPVLWALAAATMVAGNLAALGQKSVKRMLGYSSVAHMGYILMALLSLPKAGPGPIIYYSAALAFMDLGAFGGLGLLSPTGKDIDSLDDLRGLGAQKPWSGALLAVSLLALAGMPPTAGFTGKLLLFRAALQGGHLWLAAIGILAAIISIAFYLRALTALYAKAPTGGPAPAETNISDAVAVALALTAIIILGLVPAPALDAAAALGLPMP